VTEPLAIGPNFYTGTVPVYSLGRCLSVSAYVRFFFENGVSRMFNDTYHGLTTTPRTSYNIACHLRPPKRNPSKPRFRLIQQLPKPILSAPLKLPSIYLLYLPTPYLPLPAYHSLPHLLTDLPIFLPPFLPFHAPTGPKATLLFL
jgi:hypothetical protein